MLATFCQNFWPNSKILIGKYMNGSIDDGVTPCNKQHTFYAEDLYPRLDYLDGGVLNDSIVVVCGGTCHSGTSSYCGSQTSGSSYRQQCYQYHDTVSCFFTLLILLGLVGNFDLYGLISYIKIPKFNNLE